MDDKDIKATGAAPVTETVKVSPKQQKRTKRKTKKVPDEFKEYETLFDIEEIQNDTEVPLPNGKIMKYVLVCLS